MMDVLRPCHLRSALVSPKRFSESETESLASTPCTANVWMLSPGFCFVASLTAGGRCANPWCG